MKTGKKKNEHSVLSGSKNTHEKAKEGVSQRRRVFKSSTLELPESKERHSRNHTID